MADGASVLGLTYNAAARTLTGTVPAEASFNRYDWVASDSDANNTADDVGSRFFFIRVEVDIAPAFAVTSIAAQTYRQDALITPLTLPRATGGNRGNGDITYTLTPAIAGLTLNPTSRVLSGAPTTVTTATMYTYTASDSDANNAADDTATLTFSITVVEADTAPAFADGVSIEDQTYTQNTAITPLTLPVATGGNGAITYTLNPPAGLTFNPTSRVLSGTPTSVAVVPTDYTYMAGDSDDNTAAGDIASLTFQISVTVAAPGTDTAPSFASSTPDQFYITGGTVALTLPLATGGNPPYTYTLTGPNGTDVSELPAGLMYTAADRTITGMPTAVTAAPLAFTWTAVDADDNTMPTDTTVDSFTISVETDSAPAFAVTSITAQTYEQGTAIAPQTLPMATGGNGAIIYALTPAIPGLTLDAATGVLTGTPTTAAAATDYTYTAGDTDGSTAGTDEATLTISITITEADTTPTFAVSFFADQAFTTGTAVDLTLPAATGGNGALTYSLTPTIAGLTLDPTTHVLSGTPTSIVESTHTYTVTDEDNDAASLVFDVVVEMGGPAPVRPVFFQVASSVFNNYDEGGTAVGGPTTFFAEAGTETVVLTLTGADAAFFSITQAGALSFSTPPDYEMPRGMAPSTSNTNTYRVTITATASRGLTQNQGVTVNVVDVDEEVDALTVDAGADQTVAPGGTVTLTATVTGANTPDADLTVTWGVPAENQQALAAAVTTDAGRLIGAINGGTDLTLTFTATAANLVTADVVFPIRVTVTDPNGAGGNVTVTDELTITIMPAAGPPDTTPAFSVSFISPDPVFTTGIAVNLTLPAATGGNGALTYTLTPAIAGLTLNPTTHVLSGTPTVSAGSTPYTYTVTDEDGDFVSLVPDITVNLGVVDTTPAFSVSFISPDPVFTTGTAVNLTLPAATGGNGALTYTLTPAIAGLTLDPTTHVLSGTPTVSAGSTPYTYTVTDEDGDFVSLFPDITVMLGVVDAMPTFAGGTFIDDQAFMTFTAVDLTLPAATGGDGALTYSLTPTIAGLTLDPSTRVLSGTPTSIVESTHTYTVADEDNDIATLAFDVVVTAGVPDTAPSFSVNFIATQNYTTGTAVNLTLPAATGGNAPYTYTLTRSDGQALDLPGLTFNAAANPPTLTGTPTAVRGLRGHFYTVQDSDANMADGDRARLSLNIAVRAPVVDSPPSFGPETIEDQIFTVGTEVDLTLPVATGGNNGITYSLTAPPTGLTFTPSTRALSGTPAAAFAATPLTYRAIDGDANVAPSDRADLMFSITANEPVVMPTGITVFARRNPGNSQVTEVLEGASRPLRVLAIPQPFGSVFPAEQQVTFTVTPASPAARPDSPDDPYVAYNNIAPRTVVLAVGAENVGTSLTLRPTDDNFDHADFPLTITATAQPSGISGSSTLTLIDNDITIATTLAATTVVAGATATYDVTLSEQPPTSTTVTVASQGAGTATVSPATLSFTIGNWNNAQTVTVTGVAAGSTTISHTAPVASGFSYVTNDVDVTVTAAPVAPTFTNADDFDSPILTPENRATVGADGYFAATGTGTVTYALSSTSDASQFSISDTGTLTFDALPNFELGLGGPGFDSNDYTFTITATNSVGMTDATITVSVTDVNEAPVVATITPSAFTEYTQGTFDIPVTDVDAGQTLTYALSAPNHGATLTGNTFTWTPGEDDGGVARTFSFTVTDSGTPPMMVTGTFDITATELANRAPTGATITAAAMLTYPDTISLEATATDPDTGDTLTYAWNAGTEGGSIIDVVGGTATYEPPTLAAGDAARTITITVTVSDSATPPLTTTATHMVTVNPPAPMGTAPAFTNMGQFATVISVAENTVAAGGPNFFAAPGTGATSLSLDGEDSAIFAITDAGTLTFNVAPDFEMPRNGAPAVDNTNDYALTVTATNAFGMVMSGAITVRVTDVNEEPVLPEITSPTNFVEYSQGTFNIPFSDPDTGDMLTVTLTGETLGATIATDGTFTWTPGEDDGGVARTFTVSIADDGSPMMSVTRDFTITAMELDNRAPTGATITGSTAVTSPATITLEATATDADTGTTLTYTWSSDATGDSFDPATGTSTSTTWTPPVLTASDAAVTAVITVTVSDGASPALTDTDTHTVTVNPPAPVGTAPTFPNSFTSPIEAAENQTGAGVANFFAAEGTAPITLALGGTDMALFTLADDGTLTFNDAPNFEMPRGAPISGPNPNDYALTVTATNAFGSAQSGAITVTVTDANDRPVLPSFVPPTFTEYTAGTLTLAATDEDLPAQMLTYTLTGEARGATISGNVFTWTPGEADGGVVRQFGITVTDDGTPPRMVISAFNITAVELPNRDPAGAAITVTGDATSVTNPNSLSLSATATDPDTGDMLTYAWTSSATGDSFSGGGMGASTTWTPPTVTAATMVTLTVTITDSTDGSVTAMQEVTVNPPRVAPVFTNAAMFTTPISVPENTTAVGVAGFFAAPGATAYALTGTDAAHFTVTAGTLVFAPAPNFEMPRGAALSAGNTNTYTLGITVRDSINLTAQSGDITVMVTDVNERPAVTSLSTGSYTEHTEGSFELMATDEDTGQTLTYALTGTTHGATLSPTGTFRWTPGEDDGGVLRTFSFTVTDSGSPPLEFSTFFAITATELANRIPTVASITASTPVTAGTQNTVTAIATDADSDTLTYTWSSTASGDTFSPATGTSSTTTWTPGSVTTATTVTLTVTVTDGAGGSAMATTMASVNPAATTPVFNNSLAAFNVVEGTTAVGGAGQFFAIGTGTVTLTLGGTDAALFTLAADGGLAFSTAPDFEMPRGAAFDATTNTNDYPLTVTATASGLSSQPFAFTVSVTDTNEAPVLATITPPTFTEYSTDTITLAATDVDAGQMLTYRVNPPTHGATITGNTFTWTPGEDDGGVLRTFSLTVTDSGTPSMSATRGINIMAVELPNRAPTGVTITGGTMVTSPATITLEATATDPDTGTTLTYTWSSSATGDSFTPTTGTSTIWTPPVLTASDDAITVTLTVTVSDGDATTPLTDTATHTVTVNPPAPVGTAPSFGTATVAAQVYTVGQAVNVTLPVATGGVAPLTYNLTATDGSVQPPPIGLVIDPTARTLIGTPMFAAEEVTYRWTVTDSATTPASQNIDFTITVNAAPVANIAPAFVAGAAIGAATFYQDTDITPLTLPRATGGEGAITYALTPPIPGMFFDTVTGVLSGAPTTEAAATTYTYTAGDTDGSAAGTDESSLTISITVLANTIPEFSILRGPRYTFTVGDTVNQTLPAATGGDGTLVYTITRALPDGLTFNAAATPPTITGTPTTASRSVTYRYNVDDSDANEAGDDGSSISFRITVRGAVPTGITMSIRDLDGDPITSLNEGDDPTTFRLYFDTVPALSGFTADQDVTITLSTPVAGQVGYTGAASVADFIDRDVASTESRQLQLTITDDDVATADGVVTYTATVKESGNDDDPGFTATAMITLVDNEISIVTTPSTVTLATGATADYTVQLDQEPPGSVTVSVASVTDAIATVSRNTRVFTAANWNVPAPITVTGMRGGSTTISHSATAAGGFGYPSTDVMVTVTPVSVNFPAGTLVLDQTFQVGTAVDLTLPTATGATTYRLSSHADQSLPAGLTFDGATRVLSGIPTAAQTAEGYVYSARNPDNLDNLNFDITVEATGTPPTAPTAFTLAITPATVTESATATDLTATVTLTGGTFTAERVVTVSEITGGTATSGTDYTAVTDTPLTIPANAASASVTIPFTATDDMTAEAGGETVNFNGTLLTADGMGADNGFTAATASITINDPVVAPSSQTLALNPRIVTESATPTDITATVTLTGSTYNVARLFSIGSSSGSATEGTDYTALSNVVLTIPANMASGTVTFPFTAADDMVVEGGGEALNIRSTLLIVAGTDPDTSLAVANAVINISDPVAANTAPAFADGATVAAQTFTMGTAVDLTLPTATGGNPPISYTLTPAIPGLTLDLATGVLTGTPTTVAGATMHTYTAADGDSTGGSGDEDSLTFSVTVAAAAGGDTAPAFVAGASIGAETYYKDTDITPLTLPRATGGEGAITYALTPAIPGMFFDTVTGVLSGAPTTEAAATTYTYTAGDTDGSAAGTDESSLTISITVLANTIPTFSVLRGPSYIYTVGTVVNETLPAATGGDGTLVYTLSRVAFLPDGLTFNAAATPPTITGTPTTAARRTTYRYNVDDSDANEALGDGSSLSIRITIRGAAATGITMTIRDLAGNAITSLNEGADPTTFRLYFDTVPALSGFTADQDVTITLSTPVAGQVGYTGAASVADFIDRDVASTESRQLQLTVTDDDVATADGVVTYTATVSPSGFTATAMITLVDNEISIVTTPAAVTLATGSTADYTVQLDQEPPGSVTVSVVSVGDAIATVSRNTRVFTAANWNVPASVTVTGMRGGSTTISHSATAAGGFGYQSTDVMVTVTPVSVNFPAGTLILDQNFRVGTAVDLTLPLATGATTYRLGSHADRSVPAGLTFNAAARLPTLTGTPTAAQTAEGYVYSARNPDNLDNLNFDITVEAMAADTAPVFDTVQTVAPQQYEVDMAITPLTLPGVTAPGNGATTYTVTPALPDGLTFDATTRVITGTPTTAGTATVTYTLTAADADMTTGAGDEATLTFSITVTAGATPPPSSQTLTISPTMVVESATPTDITATVTLNGGTFAIERLVTVSETTGGSATSGTDYTAVTSTNVTIPANTASASVTIPFTATDDMTAEAGGETVNFNGSLLTADGLGVESTFTVATASITINDPPAATAPTAFTLAITPATVTESATATDLTATVTLMGGTFTAERVVTVSETTGGSATSGTDYTAVTSTNVTIPANTASASMTIPFTATDDMTAEAGGETVNFNGSLLTADGLGVESTFTAATASITINDPVAPGTDTAPTFSVTSITAQTFTVGTAVDLTLPAATGGDGAITYTLTRPAGLAFDSATRVLTGTPTAAAPATRFTYTARDRDNDTATLTFRITVAAAPPGVTLITVAAAPPGVTLEQAQDITRNEIILPEVARAMTNSTTTSITRRVEQAVGSIPIPTGGSFNLAGQQMGGERNLATALRTQGEAMNADSRDIKEMLAGSDFVLPLHAGGAGASPSAVALWGSGEYRNFSGESDDLDWDGDLTGFQLGLDVRLSDNFLVGVAVSQLETEMEYEDETQNDIDLGQGDYQLDMTSAHPYIGWRAGGLDLWVTVGYGTGELEITEQDANGVSQTPKPRDVNLQTIGGGGSGMLWQDAITTLRLKGEVSQTQLEVEDGAAFAEQEIDATSARLALEMSWTNRLDGGGVFEPSLEVAARYDGGDGETGGGAEVGGGLRYDNPVTRFTAESRIRALVGQGGNYEEWGISGTLRVGSGPDAQGLSFSLSPGYGDSASGIQELWLHGLADENNATVDDYAMKLDARIGYGFGFALNEHHGILTPYSELTYGTTNSYRMGLNWAAGKRFDLTLLSERRENTGDPAEHAVLLKGEVRF